jgi:hypothetical protein
LPFSFTAAIYILKRPVEDALAAWKDTPFSLINWPELVAGVGVEDEAVVGAFGEACAPAEEEGGGVLAGV